MQIYKITNMIDNKVYIGKTLKSFQYRYGKDWSITTTNRHLKNAVQLYGKHNFNIDILYTTNSKDKEILSLMEQHFIALYKANEAQYGYNFTSGGDGRYEFTKEQKLQQSLRQKGKKPAHFYTTEAREKRLINLRKAMALKPKSKESIALTAKHKTKYYMFECNGEINTFFGLQDASKFYKCSLRTLARVTSTNKDINSQVSWLKLIKTWKVKG